MHAIWGKVTIVILPYFSRLGFGREASLFFSVSRRSYLRVIYVGGPCKAATIGRFTNITLLSGFFVCLFVSVNFRFTSWNIITHNSEVCHPRCVQKRLIVR